MISRRMHNGGACRCTGVVSVQCPGQTRCLISLGVSCEPAALYERFLSVEVEPRVPVCCILGLVPI